MIDAVFIADLHLHPKSDELSKKFYFFCDWAKENTKAVYILGDFFHVWAGDDLIDAWSLRIAQKLQEVAASGVKLYFMPGNRDFLIGKKFVKLAKLTLLKDPTVVTLHKNSIMLAHGDKYCTNDRSHQLLRFITRNSIFYRLFMLCSGKIRRKIVARVRIRSQTNNKSQQKLTIVLKSMLKDMRDFKTNTLIHGHIHKPGINVHDYKGKKYKQYVVSDWDDNPTMVCYDSTVGIYLERLRGCNES